MTQQQTEEKKQLPAISSSVAQFPALAEAKFENGKMMLPDLRSVMEFSQLAVMAGTFKDVTSVAKGVIKICYGQKLGLDPQESLNILYDNQGRYGIWSVDLARKIQEHPRFSYEYLENSATACELLPLIDGKPIAFKKDEKGNPVLDKDKKPIPETVRFEIGTAQKMGLLRNAPWQNDPQLMLFYKVIARMYKMYFNNLFAGGVVSTIEDITDEKNSVEYKLDRPELVKQTAQEVANERAAEQSKKLDKVFDEALDVDTVEEIPFEDKKSDAQPKFEDRMEARARVAESEGDTKAAEETRKEAQKIADLKVEIKAVKWSDVILKATRSKYGAPQIKAWLEKRGVNCAEAAKIPQADLQAALDEMEPK